MTPERLQRIREIFERVRALPEAEWEAALGMECGGDAALLSEVRALLAKATIESTETARSSALDKLHRTMSNKPERVGPYRILSTLGEGGMGTVYLAEQEKPVRRRVALKLIKLGMDTAQVIARFESERQALAMMNHPNIASVLDAGATEQGRPYFVMEYVPGEPITKYCDKHKLSLPERLDLFMQVCHAVQHAHTKAIIHRDLKPSNILVVPTEPGMDRAATVRERSSPDAGGPLAYARGSDRTADTAVAHVKIIDFGVAKATNQRLTEHTVFTEQGQLIGTPEYMSPEQAEMSQFDIDTRTDIYSLGVLLYELLTGTLPFDPKSLRKAAYAEIQRIIREVEPQKPSTRVASAVSEDEGKHRRRAGANDPREQASEQTEPRPSGSGPAECEGARAIESEPLPHGRGVDVARVADRPFSAAEIASRRRSDPRGLIKSLRGDLDWIVMKCLEKDRTRRYETANGLAMEIRRYLSHEPVLAGPPGVGYRIGKFVKRNRVPVVAGCAFVLVLAGAAVGMTGLYFRAAAAEAEQSRAREEAVLERQRADEQAAEAKARADELEQVAKFQEEQLSGIDVQTMGVRLRADLLKKARAAAERSKRPKEEVDARIAELEDLIAGSDFTGLALAALDENVFQRALAAIEKQLTKQPLVAARLLQALADTLREVGLLDAATKPQKAALAARRRVLGDEHPETLTSINYAGVLLVARGELAEAEPFYHEALEKRRRVLGDEHADTLVSIQNLGTLLQCQGKLAEAEPYVRAALEVRRRVLGAEHPDTLDSVNSMGFLRNAQGKLVEAEGYYREALEKRRRALGDEHPDTLNSFNSMGFHLKAQGRLAEAEPYYCEALKKRRLVLGEEHHDALQSLNNMGALLQAQGKLAEAEPFYREALEKFRRVLGGEHPDTLTSLHNMGLLLLAQGKPAQGEPYIREALETKRRALGDDHPQTLNSISNLGLLLEAQGRMAEAELCWRDALEKRRRTQGDDHPDTLHSINNLGLLLQRQGRLADAERYLLEALQLRRRALGDDHPDTLTSTNYIGLLLQAQGRLAEAEPYVRHALEKRRHVLGDEHPVTVSSINNWGALLQAQGRLAEAEPYCRKALEANRSIRGDDHFDTLSSMNNMGRLLLAQGKPREVIELLVPAEQAARRAFTGRNVLRLGRFLTVLGRSQVAIAEYSDAEANLSEAQAIIEYAADATPQHLADVLTSLVELFDAWHVAAPGKGYEKKAAEWREKLNVWQATTRPSHEGTEPRSHGGNCGTTTRPATQPTSAATPP